ncbi:hypothetical protein L249_8016 [Ophiocordyceps polyrhachis-furcata BCC 54312]|uniref:Uncharacterized protein n=1 Tax=Ophiocordyceps polyrhachis-furcata BCC 54312 TaxID=1330021 RepID=A0A367LI21_9HYPO|nr:hypothetical protein L249_8016 [Ophiocordyceps polyrhachis-furcata BCC 54312]
MCELYFHLYEGCSHPRFWNWIHCPYNRETECINYRYRSYKHPGKCEDCRQQEHDERVRQRHEDERRRRQEREEREERERRQREYERLMSEQRRRQRQRRRQ